jgi:ATP-dependent Clp protease ATP-binding subunit ClpB
MPSELDEILRRVMQLEIERQALKKETDKASKERLKKLEKELADLKSEADALQARWKWRATSRRTAGASDGFTSPSCSK